MVWKEPGKDKDPWDDGGQASPDLEKLVAGLQKRFRSLLSRRRNRRIRGVTYLWLIPLLLAAWLISGLYVVAPGDRGVDLILGRYQAMTLPGLHWHVPWPLGSRQILADFDQGADYVRGYNTLLTADGDAVTAEVVVHYRIIDPPTYLYATASTGGGSAAVEVLGNLSDAAVSEAVAAVPMSELFGRGVDAVESDVRARLVDTLKSRDTGLEVTQVELRKVSMPGPVAAAYAGVRQAELEAQKQADEARAYAADVLPRARGEADSRVDAARAYAETVVVHAQGDVVGFKDVLAAYQRAPEVTRESLTLSTFEEILSHVQRVVLVAKDGHVTLSLDKPASTATKPEVGKAPTPKPAPAKNPGGGPP